MEIWIVWWERHFFFPSFSQVLVLWFYMHWLCKYHLQHSLPLVIHLLLEGCAWKPPSISLQPLDISRTSTVVPGSLPTFCFFFPLPNFHFPQCARSDVRARDGHLMALTVTDPIAWWQGDWEKKNGNNCIHPFFFAFCPCSNWSFPFFHSSCPSAAWENLQLTAFKLGLGPSKVR